jgi:hypothetical protein
VADDSDRLPAPSGLLVLLADRAAGTVEVVAVTLVNLWCCRNGKYANRVAGQVAASWPKLDARPGTLTAPTAVSSGAPAAQQPVPGTPVPPRAPGGAFTHADARPSQRHQAPGRRR